MKISARNPFRGKIVRIEESAVNGIVKMDAPGGSKLSSTIFPGVIRELDLGVGGESAAVIKATSVIISLDEKHMFF